MGGAIGICGLGRMGGGVALNALGRGMRVVGLSRGPADRSLVEAGLEDAGSPEGLRRLLPAPRVVLAYVPAGPATEAALDGLADALEPGDVLADGGNSYWGDSVRRHARYAARGVRFVDLGTSGGMDGAHRGACFMAGGDPDAVALVEAACRPLAVEGGWVHAGGPGAGHYVKLVHNGIEFGMLQALAEGFALLRAWDAPVEVQATLECWRRGSVIRSWLVDLLAEAHAADPGLARPSAHVEDTGEVGWLVQDALRMEVATPVIAQSVMQLIASRDRAGDASRAVSAMRRGFGGHPLGPDEGVARERREGLVGGIAGQGAYRDRGGG